MKLNLTIEEEKFRNLIDIEDEEQVNKPEVHFIMLEGMTNQMDMGLIGFFQMLWQSKRFEILPFDGKW